MGENIVAGFVQSLAEKSLSEQAQANGDYYDQEGLLVCGKCGERKQKIISFVLPSPLPGVQAGPNDTLKVGVQCRCRREAEAKERARDAARQELDRIASLRRMSLMDARFTEATFSNFEQTKHNERIFRLASRYVEKFDELVQKNQGLLFWGDVGTGKSYTAACIANALLDRGVPVVMTSFIKLLEELQRGDETESGLLSRLEQAKLVIFDDLGAERNTQYAMEKVYSFVDSRYRSKLPMLLTTNLTIQDMMNETDMQCKRIYDRLFEVCYPVQFTGGSFRKKAASARFEEMQKLFDE